MKKVLLSTVYILSLFLISCGGGESEGGDGNGGGPVDPPTPQKPSKAVLSKPANNTECLEVDAVKFEWSHLHTFIYFFLSNFFNISFN